MKHHGMILIQKSHYTQIAKMLDQIPFQTLFARAVLELKADGTVWGNQAQNPTTVLIVHGYGMSLLFGNSEDEHFNEALRTYFFHSDYKRAFSEWLQVYPNAWNACFQSWFGNIIRPLHLVENAAIQQRLLVSNEMVTTTPILLWDRVNLIFNDSPFSQSSLPNLSVQKINSDLYERIKGSVIPPFFWRSKEEFLSSGVGFALLQEEEIVSIAFSSCIYQDILEIGVETAEAYRGLGYARLVCQELIRYCLLHHVQPIWACKRENVGSYRLAISLGFIEVCSQPYYELPSAKESPYQMTFDQTKIRPEDVQSLLKQTYWAQERSIDTICNAMNHSLCYGILYNEKLVGFGRVVTDYATMFWICDIIIDQDHRGKQLGKWLISTITKTKELDGLYGILATKDAHGLYEQYGFTREPSKFLFKPRPQ